ncbi:uncharacterized protein LOC143294779 [Babylonia areolata]|uniref:uncharacterized protein LOC143294779 n=1 Tax=Babylonia areolata TaxID=304850 RepID=UPI003FD1D63A
MTLQCIGLGVHSLRNQGPTKTSTDDPFPQTPRDTLHHNTPHRQCVAGDGLASSDGNLHVEIGRRALWEKESNQWAIRLSCGKFSFPHIPSFDVVWTTPSGQTLSSSGYSQGQFHLHLSPPVSGGPYTCHLPQERFTEACVPSGGGPQGDGKLESSVRVDEVLARLLMVEAAHASLAEDSRDLRTNQSRLREEGERQEERVREMREEVDKQKEEMRKVREETEREKGEVATLRQEVRQLSQEVERLRQVDMTQVRLNVTASLSTLTQRLDRVGSNIAFMTKMSKEANLKGGQRVKPDRVLYNAGGAYRAASGEFTSPIAGTYFFFLKTESAINKRVTLEIRAEGRRILYLHAHDEHSYLTPGGSVVVHLARGQRVWVGTVWGSSNLVRVWTTFGGFLVHPDLQP